MTTVKSTNARNSGIDTLKCIAAILIVAIHCTSATIFDQVIHLVGRISVPLFFMITGFYLESLFNKEKVGKYVNKILKVTGYAYALYFVLYIYNHINDPLDSYLIPSFESLLKWLVSGANNIGGGHLWYLNSLVLAIGVIVLFRKQGLKNNWGIIGFLFAGNYLIATFFDYGVLYRNFLFTAIPYILLGDKIRDTFNRHTVLSSLSDGKKFTLILVFLFLLLGEIAAYSYWGISVHRDFFISLIPLCISLFLFFYGIKGDGKIIRFSSWIGNSLSTYIYIYHYCIDVWLYRYFQGWKQFIISLLITILVSYLHYSIKSMLKSRRLKVDKQ